MNNTTNLNLKTYSEADNPTFLEYRKSLNDDTNSNMTKIDDFALAINERVDGCATLEEGKIPASQLPSYVDDIIEGYYKVANGLFYSEISYVTLITGETGKIYVSLDTNITYRWSGTIFISISSSLALGETSASAYRGDRGKTAYDHSQIAHANVNATVNDTDANLKNRTNHTGTQLSSTISNFGSTVLSTALTGISIVTNVVISSTDTVLGALGKLQKQISDDISALATHISDAVKHITATERTNWGTAFTNNHTHTNKASVDLVSGTNTGNETTTTMGTLINGATAKATPIDTDMIELMDSAGSNIVKKLSWVNIKATLKTYFDTLYSLTGHTHTNDHVATTVSDSASIDLTLTGQQISASAIFGTTSGTITQGNDSRLSDARTPVSHSHIQSEITDLTSTFDQTIRTQAEFETLIASPTWLDAVSVCFVGDGGALKFTKTDGTGIKIPSTVKQIQGINSATIEVTNFAYNATTNKGALWYATLPTTDDYSISDLTVNCIIGISNEMGYYGFCNCTQLTNCTGYAYGALYGYGFSNCTKLINCSGTGTGSAGYGSGFYTCTQLINCTGVGISSGGGYGFYTCTQLTNCTGTGIESNEGYGFHTCSYLANCKASATPSTTALFGGTNTFVGATLTDLNGKVDDSQVLTNVPVGALFTDTVYNAPSGFGQGTGINSIVEGAKSLAISDYSHAEGSSIAGKVILILIQSANNITKTLSLMDLIEGQLFPEDKINIYIMNESYEDIFSKTNVRVISVDNAQSLIVVDYPEDFPIILPNHILYLKKEVKMGSCSHAEGEGSEASGEASHAEGYHTVASGESSHAEGRATVASGENSHVEGRATVASGENSHAEGYYTIASGYYSHAEGYDTTASGEASHAEGYDTTSSGDASHAEGNSTISSGYYSHAEGQNTVASGESSHAEGRWSIAFGLQSHAQGQYTIANGENQTAIGKYNIADLTSALIIGKGFSDEERSNALTVDWSGNVNIATGAEYRVNGVGIVSARSPLSDITTNTTLSLLNANTRITCTSATPLTVTVPLNSASAFTIGDSIELIQYGVGAITIDVSVGVTLLSQDSMVTIAGQYAGAVLTKMATDTWLLVGALV